MAGNRTVTWIAAMLLAVAVGAAGWLAAGLVRQRRELDLVIPAARTEGMPPHVAVVTAALGTFRGLAVDALWARADHLQAEGEYFEAQTLSQWITALQPRFQKVWAFQAWNLAYNIAAATQVPAERWGWVQRGVGLLRDQGIPLNPRAPQLQMELGWIFHNKIAGKGDKEHWFYKASLAREMQEFLGDMTSGRTTAGALELFGRVATAPATLDELRAKVPAVDRGLDLLAEHGAKPDEAFLRMLGRSLMQATSLDAKILGAGRLPADADATLLAAIRGDRETAAAILDHLVPHLQRRVLEDRYRMDPRAMLALMERYGPLDWRHPEAHGIYWTEQGIAVGRGLACRERTNELLIIRSRLHMLAELMRTGRVDYDAATHRVDLLPDPRFAAAYERSLDEAVALINSEAGVSAGEFGPAEEADLLDGYETFLNLAVILEYLYGDRADAETHFVKLRALAERLGRGADPMYADTIETFVAMRIAEVLAIDVSNLRQFLDAMIRRGLREGLAKGNLAAFNRYLAIAEKAYEKRYAAADPNAKFVLDEAKLPPFRQVVANSFAGLMGQESLPVMERARIWAWAPDQLRETLPPEAGGRLREAATAAGLDAERAFPGMPSPEQAAPAG
ncbi:MAG: hypothetical protein ACKONH_00795 [Planctomycetia bacterium]